MLEFSKIRSGTMTDDTAASQLMPQPWLGIWPKPHGRLLNHSGQLAEVGVLGRRWGTNFPWCLWPSSLPPSGLRWEGNALLMIEAIVAVSKLQSVIVMTVETTERV